MQEIAPHVFIETNYAGVTLAAINWPHGLILIDSPFRVDDTRSWRSALLNLGGGVDRLLINLDAHLDRTLGTRTMECTVVGHENMLQIFRARPVTFKTQSAETGAEWELYNNLGSIRWSPPEITFSDRLEIYWDGSPLLLEHKNGSSIGATWAKLPDQKVLFIGDAVTPNQPPFFEHANIPSWIEILRDLLLPEYQQYLLVSGRGGIIHLDEVRKQIQFLEQAENMLQELVKQNATCDDTTKLIPVLLGGFNPSAELKPLYEQRLAYGLRHYFLRHFQPANNNEEMPL